MSITNEAELNGMKKASAAVVYTLKGMSEYAHPVISTRVLNE